MTTSSILADFTIKFIEFGIRVSDSEIDRGSAYHQLMRFV